MNDMCDIFSIYWTVGPVVNNICIKMVLIVTLRYDLFTFFLLLLATNAADLI